MNYSPGIALHGVVSTLPAGDDSLTGHSQVTHTWPAREPQLNHATAPHLLLPAYKYNSVAVFEFSDFLKAEMSMDDRHHSNVKISKCPQQRNYFQSKNFISRHNPFQYYQQTVNVVKGLLILYQQEIYLLKY